MEPSSAESTANSDGMLAKQFKSAKSSTKSSKNKSQLPLFPKSSKGEASKITLSPPEGMPSWSKLQILVSCLWQRIVTFLGLHSIFKFTKHCTHFRNTTTRFPKPSPKQGDMNILRHYLVSLPTVDLLSITCTTQIPTCVILLLIPVRDTLSDPQRMTGICYPGNHPLS